MKDKKGGEVNKLKGATLFFLILPIPIEIISLSFHESKWINDYHEVASMISIIIGFLLSFINIEHKFEDLMDGFTNISNKFLFLTKTIEEVRVSKEQYGVLRKIVTPTIWDFNQNIIGWNPNWAIELIPGDSQNLYHGLRDQHRQRLLNTSVRTIEYIILQDYEIEEENHLLFNQKAFLRFLKSLNDEQGKPSIKKHVHKYKIWLVPPKIWGDDNNPISQKIEPYRDLIFIRGAREDRQNLILFFNSKGFVVNNRHEYYIEFYNDSHILSDLVTFFEELKNNLHKNNICSNKIVWDKIKNEFDFK